MTFRDLIVERLEVRNRREGLFHDLIVANNKLLQQTIEAKRNEKLKKEDTNYDGTSSRVVELEKKINKLSEERVELYKTQSENAQRLFRLSEQLRGREENEKRLSEETIQLSEQVKRLSAKCEEQVYLIREKDKLIQVSKNVL
ncbi:hypothetical protein G6F68_016695 [Rhizopus microsporus]|nr:hypothetical protein G6F68_016695 [Rhizopus microsporus]